MIFNQSAIQAICDAWSAEQDDPRKSLPKRSLPDIDKLAQLVEEAFVASLQRVEEQPTRFAIATLPRDEKGRAAILQGRRLEVLAFGTEIPFTADALSKLATACDPSLGCLLVDTGATRGIPWVIWGVAFFESSRLAFGKDPIAGLPCSMGFGSMRPDTLTISSLSPGSLDITRGERRVGQFVMGRFLPALPTPLSETAMGGHIASRILQKKVDKPYAAWYFREYRRWLEYLLVEIGRRGHGGTVIFCPESSWASVGNRCQGGQGMSRDLSLAQIIDTRYQEEQGISQKTGMDNFLSCMIGVEKCNEHIRSRLAFVAQLAVCDGALIIGEHFRPLLYGTMLPVKDWEGTAVTGKDGYGHGGTEYDLGQHGMRHRSAAAFVGEHEELFGFVISQDGPIRGFVRSKDGPLLVWSDCRASAFV